MTVITGYICHSQHTNLTLYYLLTESTVHTTLRPIPHLKLFGSMLPWAKSNVLPVTSTKLRNAMLASINASWNRSTMSAQVIWNKLSFSNFLNTLPLISTN